MTLKVLMRTAKPTRAAWAPVSSPNRTVFRSAAVIAPVRRIQIAMNAISTISQGIHHTSVEYQDSMPSTISIEMFHTVPSTE